MTDKTSIFQHISDSVPDVKIIKITRICMERKTTSNFWSSQLSDDKKTTKIHLFYPKHEWQSFQLNSFPNQMVRNICHQEHQNETKSLRQQTIFCVSILTLPVLSDPIIAFSCQSLTESLPDFVEFCSNWICQSCYMDFFKLLDGFVKVLILFQSLLNLLNQWCWMSQSTQCLGSVVPLAMLILKMAKPQVCKKKASLT